MSAPAQQARPEPLPAHDVLQRLIGWAFDQIHPSRRGGNAG